MEEACGIDMAIGGEKTQDELCEALEALNLHQETADKVEWLVSQYDSLHDIEERRHNELKELESNVIKLKNQLNKLQIKKSEYEDRDLQVKEECARLKETIETLRKELHDICAASQSLKEDTDRLHAETKPTKEDTAILEKNRKLLRLYKDLTGLKWDYTAPSSDYVGYVFNPVNIYCNHFHYPAAEASSDLVWDEIEKASHAVWSDIIGEEPLS